MTDNEAKPMSEYTKMRMAPKMAMDKRAQEVILRSAITNLEVHSKNLQRIADESDTNYVDWALANIDEAVGNLRQYAKKEEIKLKDRAG